MNLDELYNLIRTAPWFTNLSKSEPQHLLIPITELTRWQDFVTACTAAEFGLPIPNASLDANPFNQMVWLPTSQEQPDPIHHDSLLELAKTLGREAGFKAARLSAVKDAIASLRDAPDQSLLKVGPSDLNEAAKSAAKYACRMAAGEIVVDRVGFWCDMLRVYYQGNWPLGLLPNGQVVVL